MLSDQHRAILLDTAWQSIRHGLKHHSPQTVAAEQYAAPLSEPGASFITLHKEGELRGCIGSLQAYRPLLQDVAENAYAAAFRDHRFPPLRTDELDQLTMHISVLSAAQPLQFASEQDLLRQIRPQVDGLILQDGIHRGTFLPSVWESLPDPAEFLQHLKLKAGLPPDHWSEQLQVWRYTTESFGDNHK